MLIVAPETEINNVSALTNNEITAKLTTLQSKYPNGSYWLTPQTEIYGGKQCYAFARQLAVDIFGTYPATNIVRTTEGTVSNGWTAIRDSSRVTLEPGDIIRADNDSHTAMIWKIEGNYVYVAQCWGTQNNKVNWGAFWGNNKKATVSELLGSGFNGVWKHPDSTMIDPEPYLSISGYDPLPSGKLPQGKSYPVKGIVSGYPNINHVWGGVYNRDGSKTSQYLDKYVDTGSYNLATYFDPYIIFNDLPIGYYTFKIEATTTDGQYREIHSDFQIGDLPKPGNVKLSVPKTEYIKGDNIVFTPSGTNVTGGYTIGIDDASGNRLITQTLAVGETYSTSSLAAGNYSAYVTAYNGSGLTDSARIYFSVGITAAFNVNGGNCGTASKRVVTGDKYGSIPNATRSGYTFVGWYTEASGGTQVTDGTVVTSGSNHTLYAHWKADKYTVKFNGNGADELSTASKEVTYNSTYGELPNSIRAGYNFIGWYTQPEGGVVITPDTKVVITDTQTLYAQWSQVKFLITFNANGGTSEMRQKVVSSDNKYGVLPSAEKIGYEFGGWYLDEAFTKQITEDTIVKITKNQEIYAKWMQKKYTVTFEVNGGTVDMNTKKVVAGKVYGVLPEAEKNGFEFAGWFTESGKEITSDSIVELTADTVLYAKWRLRGDVDADGDVDVADVVLLQRWLLADSTTTLNDWQAGDLCEDGRIDVFDLCLLKRLLIERIGD